MTLLDTAIAAAHAGRHGDVLAALLDAWRALRAPELAALIETASAIAARDRAPITGRSQRALHAEWLAVAVRRDPADLDRLLATLAHGNLTQAGERIAWLASCAPDPRIAAGLEALIASPPSVAFVKGSAAGLWTAVCDLLARTGDPRTRTIHERLAWLAHDRAASPFDAGPKRARTTKIVAQAAQAIAPAPPLPPELRAACDELAASLAAAAPAGELGTALLGKIYDDPFDLDARAVYADWLTSTGDPRGEFIALQLARAVTPIPLPVLGLDHDEPALTSRERTLVRTHHSVWCGALGALLEHVSFERGFPAMALLARRVPLRALAARPEAATLSRLLLREPCDEDAARLLGRRPLHGLVSVSSLDWRGFAALATTPMDSPPSIRALEISDDDALPPALDFLDTAWPLEQLELATNWPEATQPTSDQLAAFLRTRLVRELRALAITHRIRDDRAVIRGFLDSAIRRLVLYTFNATFDLSVERDDDDAPRTRIVVRYNTGRGTASAVMRERAATWPRELVDTAILELDVRFAQHAPGEHDAIRAAAEAFAGELEVVDLPAP